MSQRVAGRSRANASLAWVVLALLPAALPAGGQTFPVGWRIRFDATCNGLAATARFTLGASPQASNAADDLDEPHPPALPRHYLDLVTRHRQDQPGWASQALPELRYRSEYLAPLGAASAVVELSVETDASGPALVTWSIAPDLDLASHHAVLRDLSTGTVVDLWAQSSYAFTPSPGSRILRLELTPGRVAPPVAYDQVAGTEEDTPAVVTLLAEDAGGAALGYEIVEAPAHGAVSGSGPEVTYVPASDYNGPDSFRFLARSSTAASNVATVSIAVSSVNDTPTAGDLAVSTLEDSALAILLPAVDVDADALTFAVTAPPLHGSLSGLGPDVLYTPAPDFFGADGFTYTVSDGQVVSAPGQVSIAVAAVHDPPQAAFTVPGPARNAATWNNNLASRFEGAQLLSFTSQQAASPAANALDDDVATLWQSASGQAAAQSLTLQLPQGDRLVDRLRVVNGYSTGGAAVKRFEVRVSTTTSDPGAFALVLSGAALDNDRVQEFAFPQPVAARYLSFTALDNYGSACCVALRSLEAVSPELSGVVSYAGTPANLALATNGASASATSEYPGFGAGLAIDGDTTTRWASNNGQLANQALTVTLARGESYTVSRVRIANAAGALGQAVRDFALSVSDTTNEASAFSTVLTATLQDVAGFQEFAIPGGPAAARYVRFTPVSNYGSACCVSIQELYVPPAGGPTVSVSNHLSALYRAEMALDGSPSTYWLTAAGQTLDQFLDVRLDGPAALVSGIRLQGWPGPSGANVKDFEVWATDAEAPTGHSLVLSSALPNDGAAHFFPLDAGPRRARHVRFVAKNNYGANNILLASLEVVTLASEGHRISGNATLSGVSSEYDAAYAATKALDLDPSAPGWLTALGQTTNQWLKLELPQGRAWSLDHVVLRPRSDAFLDQSPREFEVQVSTTVAADAAFTTVLSATLRNDGAVQHFFFPRTDARYLRLLLKNNYGGAAIGVQQFAAYSPEVGSQDARFLDLSTGKDAAPTTWSWDFGDGATALDRDPANAYAGAGAYDVTLAVTDASGAGDTRTESYEVVAAPQVSFGVLPVSPAEGQSATFTDTSLDPAGIAYREWFFGDGTSFASTAPTASHAFPDGGTYLVTLRVTNAWGAVSEATQGVGVTNAPPTLNAGSDARVVIGSVWSPLSTVSDPGSGDVSSLACSWDFGDGESRQVSPCSVVSSRVPHTYAEPGAYTATLTVTDKDGGVASDSVLVTVFPEHAVIPGGTYLEQPFWDDYSVKELGGVSGLPLGYGGLVFARHDPDLILVTAPPITSSAKIYEVRVTRDATGHVTGFTGTPVAVANLQNGDGGMAYGPEGVLFTAQWPNQTLVQFKPGSSQIDKTISLPPLGPRDVSLNFVPHGLPGQCSLKFASYYTADWWSANLQPDGNGTFDLTGVRSGARIHDGGVEHLAYVPRGAPVFSDGRTLLVTEWDLGNVVGYDVDDAGDPLPSTRRLVITGFASPEGLAFDPLTGDLLVTSLGGSRIRRISGFPAPSRSLAFDPELASVPVGTNHTATIRVSDAQGRPRAGVAVEIAVSAGPNAGAAATCAPNADCNTDAAGEVRFSYTGTNPGRDTLSASFFTDSCDPQSAQAHVDWTGNATPSATSAELGTAEDTALALALSGTDADGDTLSFTVAQPPAYGTLSGVAPDLTYAPAPDFHGRDEFTFTASDGQAVSAPATIGIEVAPVNDTPVAESQGVGGAEDGPVTVTLSGTDVDGDSLSFVVLSPPQHGTLTGTGETLTYTPAPDFSGTDGFSFAASDGLAQSAPAAVTLTLAPVNDAPTAASRSASTAEDMPLALVLEGQDVDGDALTYSVQSAPQHGTLSGTAPQLTYTPASDFHGPDSFTFTASDGQAVSGPATIEIQVTPVNDAPVALSQAFPGAEDAPLVVTLSGSDADGDALSFVILAPPQHGTLSGTGDALTYTPAPDFAGSDAFSFAASDGQAQSAPATVTLEVSAVNDAPVAAAQATATAEDTSVAITLQGSDVDGDALTYGVQTGPQHGTLSGTAPQLTYTPGPNFNGRDTFTFTASDGQAISNEAVVTIDVSPVNDAPAALDVSATTTEDTPVVVSLLALDADLDTLLFVIVTPPTHGTLSGSAPNLTYTPAADEHGPDGFAFQVSDGQAVSNVATVSLAVEPVNDRPVAASQSLEAAQAVATPVVLTATDVDGDVLSYTITSPPTHGTLTGTAPNLVYTSDPGYAGPDAFAFLVNDGVLDSDVASVSLSVVGQANQPPSCAAARPSLTELWPPNHKMKSLQILGVTDADGDPVTILAKTIRQDEPVEGTGDGNRTPDATLTPLQLRAERAGGGDGRVYHVSFEATDDEGASCTATVTVCTPHDESGGTCVDGGPLHDSTVEHP